MIPVYFLNLSNHETLKNCVKQFDGKEEFEVNIMEVGKFKNKEMRKWEGIKKVVNKAITKEEDLCIICKEGHVFSEKYEFNAFLTKIYEGHRLGAKYLLGGLSGDYANALVLPSGLCWIDSFENSQFIVLYNSFYKPILEEEFLESHNVEEKLSKMTSNKFLIYPFISTYEKNINSQNSKVKSEIIAEKRMENLIEKTRLYKKYQ